MKKITVEIKFQDSNSSLGPQWLNPFNLKLALEAYCENTKFEIKDLKTRLTAKFDDFDDNQKKAELMPWL